MKKRKALSADDKDSSDGSNSAYEDIVGHSRRVTLQYGVTWELFTKGNSKDDRLQALREVREVLQPSLTNAAVSVAESAQSRYRSLRVGWAGGRLASLRAELQIGTGGARFPPSSHQQRRAAARLLLGGDPGR